MDPQNQELSELRLILARLTERVYRLEQAAGISQPVSGVQPKTEQAAAITQPEDAVAIEPQVSVPPPSFLAEAKEPDESDTHDLESKIGSQWLNRIGAVAVFIGAYFFLTYAYQNHWIGPSAIISIGLLAGIGVVYWSERFRNKGYVVFSWAVKAVGIGILYLSLWAGFQVYNKPTPLIPAPYAFAGMVIVTASTIALAIAQSAEILALFALIGGFLTPLLLSTGENHEIFLFSYVSLLNLGTLVLAIYKPWRRLLPVSFVGTLILFVGWYASYYDRSQLGATLTFATIFFAIFAVVPLFVMERSAKNISPVLLLLPLANAVEYFVAIYAMLESISKSTIAWIAVALAAVYILISRQIRSRLSLSAENSRLLTLLHIALAVGFLTAAIPIKLQSYWITIGWFVESAVLLYVAYRGASVFLKFLSLIGLALGILRLVFFDDFAANTLVFNPRFAIYLVAIAVVVFAVYLARTQGERENTVEQTLAAIGVVLVNLLALIALCLEAHTYFDRQIQAAYNPRIYTDEYWKRHRDLTMARDFAFSAIWMVYGTALMVIGFWKRSAFLRWQALILLAITVIKVFIYDTSQLEFGYRIIAFIALGILLMGVSFVYQRDWLKLSKRSQKQNEGISA